ncbi:MAG: SDR family oxidoreductase [Synechococcaceae cyanobacterium SM2_3_1]|nr:SDR family oxidoreductase [Synechococcaceae cyanobacterium SM2_3_1]
MNSAAIKPRRALITGASRGIGRAVAERLAAAGVEVGLVARSSDQLQQVSVAIQARGGHAHTQVLDLLELQQIPQQLQELVERMGGCDLLINNAGMGYTAPVADTPLADWQKVMDLNLTAAFLCIQGVLPHMRQQQRGTIINVVSVAGKQAFPSWGAYSASKFGLMGLSQALAQEERSHGIRVTAFCPGAVDTDLWDSETVKMQLDRSQMLRVEDVADYLVQVVLSPPTVVVEEIMLMPAGGVL